LSRSMALEMTMAIGSPLFMAPELLIDKDEYDEKADVFAFAVTLHRFFTDSNVFADGQAPRSSQQVQQWAIGARRLGRPAGVSDFLWALIEACWDQEPGNRFSFKVIARHLSRRTEKYAFPGANIDAVKEYEKRVWSRNEVTEDLSRSAARLIAGVRWAQWGQSFYGIIAHLTVECDGNVHDKGVVCVTGKSRASDLHHERNAVDFGGSDGIYYSDDGPGQWLCLDFGERRVRLTHYSLASQSIKSWLLEVSEDGGR